jgi:opacity protein-like surface antigen
MNRQLVAALLLLGTASAVQAQEEASESRDTIRNVAAEFSAAPASSTNVFHLGDAFALPPVPRVLAGAAMATTAENGSPDASPSPSPDPKFIYGGRGDFRWQLAIGVDWFRFRSSIFDASAVGVESSVTYFTNEWFGIEGSVTTAFSPVLQNNEHVKLLLYGGGPKVAWRQRSWEPWLHAILGGAHVQPQTADNSKNAFAVKLGGGADYRFNPRFSGRLEADWVRTTFFTLSQNNFELMGGIVFHF